MAPGRIGKLIEGGFRQRLSKSAIRRVCLNNCWTKPLRGRF